MERIRTLYNQIKQLPENTFSELTANPDRIQAIREQFHALIEANNVRAKDGRKLKKGEIEPLFHVSVSFGDNRRLIITNDRNDDREMMNLFVSYYVSRLEVTLPKNRGELKRALSCFGHGEVTVDTDGKNKYDNGNVDYISKILDDNHITHNILNPSPASSAEVTSEPEPKKVKTEQQKDAEQDAGRKAVEAHQSRKSKSVKETSAEQPAPERSVPTQAQPAEQPDNTPPVIEQKEIGTAFLSCGCQFILYKPSEAYKKPERLAVIKDYLYADTLNILYGQAGSKKTFFAVWEAVALVTGKELFGMPILASDRKVLYISLEMSAKDIADRVDGMTKLMDTADRKRVDDNLLIISAEDTEHMNARNVNFRNALQALCDTYHFTDIYIDALSDYITGLNIRDEGNMGDVINDLRAFSLKNHVSFHIIHHGVKPTKDSQGSMAGIHTIRDLVDHVYLLRANSETELFLTAKMSDDYSAKSRYGMPTSMNLRFTYGDGMYSFNKLQGTETASYIERSSYIYHLIEEEQGITANKLRELDHNANDHTKVRDSMIGKLIICNPETRNKQKANCYYTVEYWRDREEGTSLFE